MTQVCLGVCGMTAFVFSCSSQAERKSFFLHLSPFSLQLSFGSMCIILEQLDGLTVWPIIHSNTFSLCWSIARDVVRTEKVYFFHGGRHMWSQEQLRDRPPRLMDSTAFHPEKSQRECLHVFFFFSHTALFIHFPRHPGNLELFICFEIWQIPRGNNSWQVVSHEIEAFFFPFSLISDSKIRHRVWVPGPLLCALSLSQSHQDFLIAYRRMRCE